MHSPALLLVVAFLALVTVTVDAKGGRGGFKSKGVKIKIGSSGSESGNEAAAAQGPPPGSDAFWCGLPLVGTSPSSLHSFPILLHLLLIKTDIL